LVKLWTISISAREVCNITRISPVIKHITTPLPSAVAKCEKCKPQSFIISTSMIHRNVLRILRSVTRTTTTTLKQNHRPPPPTHPHHQLPAVQRFLNPLYSSTTHLSISRAAHRPALHNGLVNAKELKRRAKRAVIQHPSQSQAAGQRGPRTSSAMPPSIHPDPPASPRQNCNKQSTSARPAPAR